MCYLYFTLVNIEMAYKIGTWRKPRAREFKTPCREQRRQRETSYPCGGSESSLWVYTWRSFVYLLGRFCGVDFSLSFSLSNRGFLGGFSSSSTWGLDDNVRVRKEGKLAAPWFNPKRERQTRRNASSSRFQSQKKKIDKKESLQPAGSVAKTKGTHR